MKKVMEEIEGQAIESYGVCSDCGLTLVRNGSDLKDKINWAREQETLEKYAHCPKCGGEVEIS